MKKLVSIIENIDFLVYSDFEFDKIFFKYAFPIDYKPKFNINHVQENNRLLRISSISFENCKISEEKAIEMFERIAKNEYDFLLQKINFVFDIIQINKRSLFIESIFERISYSTNYLKKEQNNDTPLYKSILKDCLISLNNNLYVGLSELIRNYPKVTIPEFVLDEKLEKTEPYKFGYLIANDELFFSKGDYFYKEHKYTSANSLSKIIRINKQYLSDT